ncbi:hypothetical protein [Crocosphaera sp. XPORK-15E]|uniref:hypothetical protein n=1 Tax=Crocosphaera sp. XPORK-15E TaxID=3110247 RepID=UPI002B220AC7|nr:hypothetical protein [Crocosphaera sp. XPORK-15E]MEA5537193.1 hypothetical protein [Crocosphaera sp. XPORK-15E]
MTATINVGDTCYVKLRDNKERLFRYLCGLVSWIKFTKISAITFCENSNTDYDFTNIIEFANYHDKQLEVLVFDGNQNTKKYGKGYGEGKILDYAVNHSQFLVNNPEKNFYKITGHTFVENFDNISERHLGLQNVFDKNSMDKKYLFLEKAPWDFMFDQQIYTMSLPERFKLMKRSIAKYVFHLSLGQWRGRPHIKSKISTRFYKCNVGFYKTYLINAYKKVNDSQGYFLEKVYGDELEGKDFVSFLEPYRFVGISGTGGNLLSGAVDYTPEIQSIAQKFM